MMMIFQEQQSRNADDHCSGQIVDVVLCSPALRHLLKHLNEALSQKMDVGLFLHWIFNV